uniref:Neck appendage protein n=1 Tax=Gaunavirus GA1 TaxID=12345 RepID=UPI0001C39768|nr:Chain A, Neck appendage protein [Bacillus phage GA1]3GUD_B Chain B, Neck appendage protein [Bacillus phage GA1]
SDERHKTDIAPISDKVLDAWEKVKFYQYKFKDAVDEKGEEARYHFGVIAQQIVKVFEDEGLSAFDYGLVGYDEWEATEDEYDSEGNLVEKGREAGNIYSIRPTECQWLEMACMRRKLERLSLEHHHHHH